MRLILVNIILEPHKCNVIINIEWDVFISRPTCPNPFQLNKSTEAKIMAKLFTCEYIEIIDVINH